VIKVKVKKGVHMKCKSVFFASVIVLALALPSLAQEDKLGKVSFPTSCDPKVQALFERGVAMLHSFWYSEGDKMFRDVLSQDPSCAIATWGIAALLMSNPLAGVGSSPKGAAQAQAAIEQGRKIGAKTQRERDYIEAVAAYYEDWTNRYENDRQKSRAKAYEALAARYPDDDEAQIFYALYLAGTQSQSEQTFATYLKSASILEKQFTKYPDHPGVAHYLIHSYDAPPIAQKGLPAARRYASIAPAAPHALHMPSHIFTRVGAWADSAATNQRSAEAAKKANDKDDQMHALDYMVYAYLQLARDNDARLVMEEATQISGFTRNSGPYAFAAIPARYAIERGDWSGAMKLQPIANDFHYTEALTRFARALGAARSGDTAAAETEVGHLARLRDALKAAKNEYWVTEVEISRLAASAWTALALGKKDEAVKLMRSAADMEDKNEKHIVTPGRIVPARELLGQMLLELKRPGEALKEFEASQIREPNRFHGFAGAAQAAAQSGNSVKAKQYYNRLVELVGKGGPRPELEQAKTFLAQR
jgi:tetratricopeptide (TPR) repeat protein